MDRRTFIAAAIPVSTVGLSGCLDGGGGGDAAPTETPQRTPTPTEPPTGATATPTETSTDTPGGTPTPESVGQREFPGYNWEVLDGTEPEFATEIALRDTQFHPLIGRVPRGVSIPFTNEDSFAHSVTVPALDIDTRLEGGASMTVTFDTLDRFDYVCRLHPPSMLGRVIVVDGTPTATSTSEGTPTPTPTSEGTPTPTRTPTGTPSPTPTETDDGGGGGYY